VTNILKDLSPHLDAQLDAKLAAYLPEHPLVVHAITEYARYGRMPGGFMTAMLHGKLYLAAMLADEHNFPQIGRIAMAIVYYLPDIAYGSEARVDAYAARRCP